MEDLCRHFLTDYPKFIHLEARGNKATARFLVSGFGFRVRVASMSSYPFMIVQKFGRWGHCGRDSSSGTATAHALIA